MAFNYGMGLLAVPADPRFYPHVERHLSAMLEICAEVRVLAIFPLDAPPAPRPRVEFISVAAEMPRGGYSFIALMKNYYRQMRVQSAELVEAVDPPCLFPAALALLLRKTRLVYFSMEIYPELPSLVRKPLKRLVWKLLERWGSWRANSILSVNASVARVISANLGGRTVGVVRSMPWKNQFQTNDSKGMDLRSLCGVAEDVPLLIYQGVVEEGRGLRPLADALVLRPGVHLAVMGYGPLDEWLRDRASRQSNLHFLGAFPFAELMALGRGASAGVVCIEPASRSFELSLPGKLFEYVCNGLPVLGTPLPEIAAHIRNAGVGEIADSWTPVDLANAIDRLCVGLHEQRYVEPLALAARKWNWENESRELCKAYAFCNEAR